MLSEDRVEDPSLLIEQFHKMDELFLDAIDLAFNMPQGVQEVSLPGEVSLERDSTIYQGAMESFRPDHLAMPRLPSFALDSDIEMSSSQKSSSSQLFDFRKLGIRLSSQGSVTDSEDGFFNFSQEPAFTEVEGLLKNVFTRHSELDKGAVYDPSLDSSTPRSETPKPQVEAPTEDLPDLCDSEQNMVTPQKSSNSSDAVDPLTPMANLKMLISAASPEIRNRERAKQRQLELELLEDDVDDEDSTNSSTHSNTSSRKSIKASKKTQKDVEDAEAEGDLSQPTSRKDKSLGLLCQRFLARYPEYPEPYENIRISLDEASKDLNVERRRIYDIVNVLESVEIVSRVAKNKYCWHGKTNLPTTLARLKALGRLEGFEEQLSRLKEGSMGSEQDSTPCSPRKKQPFKSNDDSNIQGYSLLRNSGGVSLTYNIRKDKSLGIMSQKFLMLFLVSEPRTVNLDMAAKILIGDPNLDKTESSKFKTKIRRLYDIANILTSLNLIRKVHVTETRGRKPAFQYVGPDVHVLNPDERAHPVTNRPTSRHSLLDSKLSGADATKFTVQEYGNLRTVAQQGGTTTGLNKRSFSRHSSFEQICQVAEQERNRLYFESRSQPTSPVKTKPNPLRSCSTIPTCSLQPTFNGSLPPGEQFVFIRGSKPTNQVGKESEEGDSCPPVTSDAKPEVVVQEVKAEVIKDGVQIATDSSKQTTVTLTKQDLNTIIRKLSNKDKDKPCLESADLDSGSTSGLVNSILEIVNKAQETESVQAADVGSNASHIRLVQLPGVQTGCKRPAADAEDIEQPPTKRVTKYSLGGSTQAAPIPGVRRLWLEPDVSPKQQQPSISSSPTEQPPKPRDLYTPPATNSVLTPTFRLATTSPPVMMLPAQPETLGVPKSMSAPSQQTPSDQPRIVRKFVSLSRQPLASPLPRSLNGQAGGVVVNGSTSVVSVPQNTTPTGRFFHNNPAVLGSRVVTPSGTVVLTNGHQGAGQQLSTPVGRVVYSSVNSGSGPQGMPTSRVLVRKIAQVMPQSQGMVTPTNTHALSTEIKPSSSIINLVPYLNSPNAGDQVSSRVPLGVVRIHRDGGALSPGQSQVTLVTPPQDLSMSGSACTPQVSVTPQSSSNAFYYSTPSSLSPTQTATQVITTHSSAFQPVHTSLTARRLSMPKQ